MDPYIGEVRNFGFTFAPMGWLPCDGRLLKIVDFSDLYSQILTTYGGDGHETFGLPDLRGRAQLHCGQGTGLSNYHLGNKGGIEFTVLTVENVPPHTHALMASTCDATLKQPENAVFANVPGKLVPYNNDVTKTQKAMDKSCITQTGDSQPNENRQPFLVTNFCIAYMGIYPSND